MPLLSLSKGPALHALAQITILIFFNCVCTGVTAGFEAAIPEMHGKEDQNDT